MDYTLRVWDWLDLVSYLDEEDALPLIRRKALADTIESLVGDLPETDEFTYTANRKEAEMLIFVIDKFLS